MGAIFTVIGGTKFVGGHIYCDWGDQVCGGPYLP